MGYPSDHAWPSDLPLWTIEGHELAALERVAAVPFEQGEDRHRDQFTFTAWRATVSSPLWTQAQYDRFDAWFESALQAGAELFDVPVHSLDGAGVQWWQARFLAPPRVQPRRARVRISAELLLLDGPYAGGTGPGTEGDTRVPPALRARLVRDSAVRATPSAAELQARVVRDSEIRALVDNTVRARVERDTLIEARPAAITYRRLVDGAIGVRLIDGDTPSERLIDSST